MDLLVPYLGHATPAFILLWAGLTVRAVYYYIASEGDAQFLCWVKQAANSCAAQEKLPVAIELLVQ